jgi:hypothetical protein
MAGDDNVPPAPKGRRRKPPVLELEATEVPGATRRASTDADAADATARARAEETEERAFEWRALLRFAPAATAAAAIVAAVVAILVVLLFERGSDPRLTKLASDVAALNQRLDSAGKPESADPAAARALTEQIERLAATLQAAEQRIATVEGRPVPVLPPMPDLSPLNARVGRIEAALAERQAAEAAAVDALTRRLAALEERIKALSANARAAVAPALAAEIVALGALRDVMTSGAPFATELAAVRALLGERAAKLNMLDRVAASGLSTTAQLARRFAELAPLIAREPEAEGGYLSRLVNSASRLVEVRPVGEIKGDTAGAVVARIEAQLRHDDLPAALAEAERLPASAKATAAEWIAAARAKRDAELAIKELIAAALSTLGRKRQ